MERKFPKLKDPQIILGVSFLYEPFALFFYEVVMFHIKCLESRRGLPRKYDMKHLDVFCFSAECINFVVVYLRLEEEEGKRQKFEIEKNSLDQKLRKCEEDIAVLEDSNQKLGKEKKIHEERLAQLSQKLTDEEEKVKQLTKLRNKNDVAIKELDEKGAKEEKVPKL